MIHLLTNLWSSLAEWLGSGELSSSDMSLLTVTVTCQSNAQYAPPHLSHAMHYSPLTLALSEHAPVSPAIKMTAWSHRWAVQLAELFSAKPFRAQLWAVEKGFCQRAPPPQKWAGRGVEWSPSLPVVKGLKEMDGEHIPESQNTPEPTAHSFCLYLCPLEAVHSARML